MALRLLPQPQLETPSETHREDDYPMTEESINRAKLAQLRERAEVTRITGVTFNADGTFRLPHLDLGVTLGNWICAAVYGTRGEWRN